MTFNPQTQPTVSSSESPTGLWCLIGSDDALALRTRRDELVAGSGADSTQIQRLNLAEDPSTEVLMAASAPSLFGGPRVLICENFENFSAEYAKELGEALAHSDALIIALANRAPAKSVLDAIGAKVEKISQPQGKAVAERLIEMAARRGVALDRSSAARISKGKVADWEAVDDALSKLEDLGINKVGPSELLAIEAVVGGEPAPWDLSDAIEGGDPSGAVSILARREGPVFVTFSYLANRVRDLSMVKEAGASSAEEVQRLCKINHPFPAKKLLELARRTSPETIDLLWEVIGRTDLRLRRESDTDRVIEEAVVAMARAMARTTGR